MSTTASQRPSIRVTCTCSEPFGVYLITLGVIVGLDTHTLGVDNWDMTTLQNLILSVYGQSMSTTMLNTLSFLIMFVLFVVVGKVAVSVASRV